MDEWARFMNNTDVDPAHDDDQKIITYTVAIYQPTGYKAGATTYATKALCLAAAAGVCTPVPSNTDQGMVNLMRSAATAGGGIYFDGDDIGAIQAAFKRMLNEVQAKNSVFVSASLPVSVNAQGTFLNQVYMGMFRPEATGNPRWLGNLKEYKIVQDPVTLALSLADSNNAPAVNPATGFVSPLAVSFWTSGDDYWKNDPSGTPKVASDLPDGEIVEKGGAGEQIRLTYGTSQDPRKVWTCPSGGCSAGSALSFAFNTSNVAGAQAQTDFGVGSPAELQAMVDWIRGQDNKNAYPPCDPAVSPCAWTSAEKGPGWSRTVRPSVHGDVLHSRPRRVELQGPRAVHLLRRQRRHVARHEGRPPACRRQRVVGLHRAGVLRQVQAPARQLAGAEASRHRHEHLAHAAAEGLLLRRRHRVVPGGSTP
jgi:hypothetical protein